MAPQFVVFFNDHKQFFYPGEKVAGNITMQLNEAIKYRSLKLKFKGKSYVHWTTGSNKSKQHHENIERYFDDWVFLMPPLPPHSSAKLGPGELNYPFNFELPNDLPPSFETIGAETGYIRYYMKIKINIDSRVPKSNIEQLIPLKVVAPPAYFEPSLFEPARDSVEKLLCCFCCESGPITLSGQVHKQGYYLDEQIALSVEIDNRQTSQGLRKVEARLIERLTFITDYRTRCVDNVRSSTVISERGVAPREMESWHGVKLNTPTDIMPSFSNCECLHLEYVVSVIVKISSAFNPKLVFPIVIKNRPAVLSQPVAGHPFITQPGIYAPQYAPGVLHPPSCVPGVYSSPSEVVYPMASAPVYSSVHPPTAQPSASALPHPLTVGSLSDNQPPPPYSPPRSGYLPVNTSPQPSPKSEGSPRSRGSNSRLGVTTVAVAVAEQPKSTAQKFYEMSV